MVDELTDPGMIRPGQMVMVRTAETAGEMNGHLPLVCWAEVIGPAEREDMWWVNVWLGQTEPLPQMYWTREILGTPALGLHYRPVI